MTKNLSLLLIALCFTAVAQNNSSTGSQLNAAASESPSNPPGSTLSGVEMQQVARVLAGRWLGKITADATSHAAGTADENWHLSPGGLTLIEENRLSTPKGDSYDYAAVWWNGKAQKYQGIWCAEINDEGCNAFDVNLKANQVEMTGEWEQKGHRRAWREVFSRPSESSSLQTLEIGEPGGQLKAVSKIEATKAPDGRSEGLIAKPHLVDVSAAQTKSPNPEMQRLFDAQLGRWSQHEERADGSTGDGEALWSPGPGGMSLVENEYIRNSAGEMSGLSVTWHDQDARGYRALWCSNKLRNGCLVMSKLAQWEGDQFVLRDEFESDGKKLDYKEVESGITPTTYTLTSYLGEPGGELRATSTVHATKTSGENVTTPDLTAEAELRAFMDELRKASLEGDVDTIANSMTDDYVQTDINGYRQDKTTWLNEYFRPLADLIKAGKFHWVEFERTNLQFRFYGHCAIVTGELHAKATGARPGAYAWVPDPNASFSGTLHFTHVYIKRSGRWLIAALHNQLPPPPAQTSSADSSSPRNDITAIQQGMSALRSAELRYDSAAAANLLHDDFLLTAADGNVYSKPLFLKLVADTSNPLELFEFSEMTVHLYDSTAVVSARLHEKGYMDGKPYEQNGRPTWTWVKRNNRWLCVAAHD